MDYFDSWSKNYENSWMQRSFFDPIHNGLLSSIRTKSQPKSILDVGCGTGRLLRKARERWPKAKLIGVDASKGMIEEARKLTPYAKFYISMAESLPLPDASIDIVFSTTSFHHWSNQLEGIQEVTRVLRHGGQFYLADMKISPFMSKIFTILNPNNPHSNINTTSKTQEMFFKAGLDVKLKKESWYRFEIVGKKH